MADHYGLYFLRLFALHSGGQIARVVRLVFALSYFLQHNLSDFPKNREYSLMVE